MSEEQRTYTRDEVTGAVNKGADLVLGDGELPPPPPPGETSDSIRVRNIVDLAANAALHLLDNPGTAGMNWRSEETRQADDPDFPAQIWQA